MLEVLRVSIIEAMVLSGPDQLDGRQENEGVLIYRKVLKMDFMSEEVGDVGELR